MSTSMPAQVTLTEKEQALYDAISKGMDQPGEGWLQEFAEETRETAGILGSLVKKGLVVSYKEKEPGLPAAYWVTLA